MAEVQTDRLLAFDHAKVYIPSPTVAEFIRATRRGPLNEMRLLILRGPKGEGKTLGTLWGCVALAERVAAEAPTMLPVRVGVVRDTMRMMESHLLMRHYDGFLGGGKGGKGPRLRGRF